MSTHLYPAWTVAQPFATLEDAIEAAEARYKAHNNPEKFRAEAADIWSTYA